MLWTFSAVIPLLVWYAGYWEKHWTISSTHFNIMQKCYGFLLLMVLIMPSLGSGALSLGGFSKKVFIRVHEEPSLSLLGLTGRVNRKNKNSVKSLKGCFQKITQMKAWNQHTAKIPSWFFFKFRKSTPISWFNKTSIESLSVWIYNNGSPQKNSKSNPFP